MFGDGVITDRCSTKDQKHLTFVTNAFLRCHLGSVKHLQTDMTLSNCCGAATRHNPDPQSTSGLLCVKCKLNCCEQKPMKHNVKAGDAFMFGGLRWEVEPKYKSDAAMFRSINEDGEYMRYLLWAVEDASSLDWIKPEARFTKEQRQAITNCFNSQIINQYREKGIDWTEFKQVPDFFEKWLDSHTE